jgi:hypothetical protein
MRSGNQVMSAIAVRGLTGWRQFQRTHKIEGDATVTSEQDLAQITTVAQEYLDTPEDELELLLHSAWNQAGLYAVPTRGSGREFWRDLRADLLERAVRERESVSVLTAMVAADIVQWASEKGIPVDHYSFPIGLLVAWVTAGALKRRDPDDHEQE